MSESESRFRITGKMEEQATQYVLVISNGYGRTRAEGPMNLDQAMMRRNHIWDEYEGLSIEIILMGGWDES